MSTINHSQNVTLYGGIHADKRLSVCSHHQDKLNESISKKLTEFIYTKYFQNQLSDFLSEIPGAKNTLFIKVTQEAIEVEKTSFNLQDARSLSQKTIIDLSKVANNEEKEELEYLCTKILEKANRLYNKCINKHGNEQLSSSTNKQEKTSLKKTSPSNDDLGKTQKKLDKVQKNLDPLAKENTVDIPSTSTSNSSRKDEVEKVEKITSPSIEETEEIATLKKTVENLENQKTEMQSAYKTFASLQSIEEALQLVDSFETDSTFNEEQKKGFQKLPKSLQHDTFFYLYTTKVPPNESNWESGRYYFYNDQVEDPCYESNNRQRAFALRNACLRHLAAQFTNPLADHKSLHKLFATQPDSIKNNIYRHLWHLLQPLKEEDQWGYGEKAFLELEEKSCTDLQRSEAILHHITEQLINVQKENVHQAISCATETTLRLMQEAALKFMTDQQAETIN